MAFAGVRSAILMATAAMASVGCAGISSVPSRSAFSAAADRSATPSISTEGRGVTQMGKSLKQRDLLYVSNGNGTVNVYRYWQRTLVGVLTSFSEPVGECADRAGNVYITDRKAHVIYEYAHGGSKAIATLDDPQAPWACSVDPSSGNLAVANYRKGSVTVYAHATGKPVVYTPSYTGHMISCAYDDRGDLLAALGPGYYGYYTYFYYLPKHGSSLIPMDLPSPYYSGGWTDVDAVAWDGKYWVVEAYDTLYRYTIDIQGKLVSSTQLAGGYGFPGPLAVYRKSAKGIATQVVRASATYGGKGGVNYWKYPAGGEPIGDVTQDLDAPFGVAISLGT